MTERSRTLLDFGQELTDKGPTLKGNLMGNLEGLGTSI
jgi:hypothetical protein